MHACIHSALNPRPGLLAAVLCRRGTGRMRSQTSEGRAGPPACMPSACGRCWQQTYWCVCPVPTPTHPPASFAGTLPRWMHGFARCSWTSASMAAGRRRRRRRCGARAACMHACMPPCTADAARRATPRRIVNTCGRVCSALCPARAVRGSIMRASPELSCATARGVVARQTGADAAC